MTQMAIPVAYSSRSRAEVAPVVRSAWRLRGAGFAAALVVNLGTRPAALRPAGPRPDRGVLMAAVAADVVVVGPQTRLVAVQPAITAWR